MSFWEEYLPRTPPVRFDWMESNPAGSAIWLFAIEEKTGMLAGMISLFPKDLFLDGKKIKAAILGDFMLHEKFRVFGPALDLLKAAIAFQKQGEFDFLYTIPNQKSKKIVERAGFRPAGNLYSMMCPQRCDFFIDKYVGSLAAKILEKPLMLILRIFSQATYVVCPGVVEETDWRDDAFDEFFQQASKSHMGLMTGDYSLSYLDWRYRQNQEFDFQVFTFRERVGADILGFFALSSNKYRLELYAVVALNNEILLAMINKVYTICKEKKCRGIYSSIYENNPLLPIVKRCCFFDTKDQVEIYTYPEEIREIEQWAFTAADRNI